MAEGHILLVEDDESLRSVVARHLRARGWEVTEATSAEEAARALETGPRPSLVFLDINLPGETGWDLLRGGALGGVAGPPVVVVTATTIGPRRLREFGVAGYLPKPFALETLLEVSERFAAGAVAPDRASNADNELETPS
ncbi:MAG TPA: response regulator [Candidatus Nanopelagicales bacterium]|nr:response regulator [Candidatus Nanopelagicales bacterium]